MTERLLLLTEATSTGFKIRIINNNILTHLHNQVSSFFYCNTTRFLTKHCPDLFNVRPIIMGLGKNKWQYISWSYNIFCQMHCQLTLQYRWADWANPRYKNSSTPSDSSLSIAMLGFMRTLSGSFLPSFRKFNPTIPTSSSKHMSWLGLIVPTRLILILIRPSSPLMRIRHDNLKLCAAACTIMKFFLERSDVRTTLVSSLFI